MIGTQMHAYVCIRICIHALTQVFTHMSIYIYTHTHMYICIHIYLYTYYISVFLRNIARVCACLASASLWEFSVGPTLWNQPPFMSWVFCFNDSRTCLKKSRRSWRLQRCACANRVLICCFAWCNLVVVEVGCSGKTSHDWSKTGGTGVLATLAKL